MSDRRIVRPLAWFVRLLHERTIIVLTVTFFLATGALMWHVHHLQSNLVQSQGLQDAARYSQALAEFRTLYTSEVVTAVKAHGIEVTHDYKTKEGAIPLPATLSMLLGNRMAEHGSGGRTSLYSPYPFPWRQKEGGLRDDFSREAWNTFLNNPDEPFYRFEDYDGRPALRYATADLMRASCVNCHNTHPDTPKNDWKVGDVRGVLEVITPLDGAIAQSRANLRGTFVLMIGMTLVVLSSLVVVIRKLQRTSSELEDRVQERTVELEATNESLEHEVVVRKRAEEQLRRHKEVLEELVEERTTRIGELKRQRMEAEKIVALGQVAAGVAHEINNPLASIKNCFHIVKGALPRGNGVENFSASIDKDIERISTIVRNMYHLYQPCYAEAGPLRIDAVLGEVLFTMQGAIHACGVTLLDERDMPDVEVTLPSGELAQIFINLIRNALEAMPQGGRLRVKTSKDKQGVLVEIADTGPGIPPDVLPRIFEPFFSTKPSIANGEQSGMGLGLSVTRSLVEGMGGRIDVKTECGTPHQPAFQSVSSGWCGGTCFTIWLPLIASPPPDYPAYADHSCRQNHDERS